ncbi:MAG: zinc ribbon domain-containing protein [Nitrososphaerales archaeon]
MYCANCGTPVDEGAGFCPNCGAQVTGSAAVTGAQRQTRSVLKGAMKPRTGYILSTIGGVLTFLDGIAYLYLGVPVYGVLGLIFGFLILIYSRKIYKATDVRTMGIGGVIPFVIGWFLLLASGTLIPFDIGVTVAGFLVVVGGIGSFAGK